MTDSEKKRDRIKTHFEIAKEASEMVSQFEFPTSSEHPVLERFSKFSEVYMRLTQENEARKSEEQRALEDAERKQRWALERENKA